MSDSAMIQLKEGQASWIERRLISFDETPIFYRIHDPGRPACAAVLVVHGLGEHGGRYREFCEYLGAMDVLSIVPDLRGHGHSGGKRVFAKNFSEYYRDLETTRDLLEKTYGDIPVFLLGHSFGGLVAPSYLAFARPPKIRGIILSSPLVKIAWKDWLQSILGKLEPWKRQDYWIQPAWLTHDPEVLARYDKDALMVRRVSARLFWNMLRMGDRWKTIAQRIKTPLLIVRAGDEKIVSNDATSRFYDFIKSADKEIETYPGMHHEVLQEIERQKVYSRIGAWILSRIGQRSVQS